MRAWIAVFGFAVIVLRPRPPARSLVLALDLPTMVTRADHVAVVDVASVKADWDANHEQILSTIDLVGGRELEGRRRRRRRTSPSSSRGAPSAI